MMMMNERINQMLFERMQQDSQIRARHAQTLAEEENPIGLYEMGIRYLHGWVVQVDLQQAFAHLDKAAQCGHAGACYELARQYIDGNTTLGIVKNLDTAQKYIDYAKNVYTTQFDTPNYKQETVREELVNLEKVIRAIRSMNRNTLRL